MPFLSLNQHCQSTNGINPISFTKRNSFSREKNLLIKLSIQLYSHSFQEDNDIGDEEINNNTNIIYNNVYNSKINYYIIITAITAKRLYCAYHAPYVWQQHVCRMSGFLLFLSFSVHLTGLITYH